MRLLQRLRAWWNKDAVENAQLEAGMTQQERDSAEEDFEARKDDVAARGDAFAPATNRWRRLPDLPLALNHAAAAGYRGQFYVVGGYSAAGASRRAFALRAGVWHRLPDLPEPRAAAAAAVVAGKLYVVGGV